MNPKVDQYLEQGCMRCKYGATSACKALHWSAELKLLRLMMADCGLQEDYKWQQPCYTHKGKNILLLTAFKNYASISFFKGALLNDALGLLEAPGDNSQAYRQLHFTSIKQIAEKEAAIKSYIFDAINIENEGRKINRNAKNELTYPDELTEMLNKSDKLKEAFEKLSPGRKRGYLLYFAAAKQSQTRITRIVKHIPDILTGKGIHDD